MDTPRNDHSRTFEIRSTAGHTVTRVTGETNARELLTLHRASAPGSPWRKYLVERVDGLWLRVLD